MEVKAKLRYVIPKYLVYGPSGNIPHAYSLIRQIVRKILIRIDTVLRRTLTIIPHCMHGRDDDNTPRCDQSQ